ncbi:MAG TPA: DUF5683 domain-containing protein [Agriterribacter sp.]|nr:DUF5683 domain-containing protein [Agriterribacter sp.]
MLQRYILFTCILTLSAATLRAQNDTTVTKQSGGKINDGKDTLINGLAALHKKKSPASKAAMLSAILPGAGQAYNKKYWKIPVVYGALAIPTYTFIYNLKWFNRTRYAYNVLVRKDTANFVNVYPPLQPLVQRGDASGLQNYRNDFRRNVDYSALAFLILWGLNIADAAVDAHLKDFDITEDLSLQIKPGYMPISNTVGLGIVLNIGKQHPYRLPAGR